MRFGPSRVPLAPLAALFTFTVLAIAWVASAHLCTRPIVVQLCGGGAMTMDGSAMPGMAATTMPMAMAHTPFGDVMVCPVVLGLIVLSAALGTWAIVSGWRDPDRLLSLTVLVRSLARLPVLRTFALLAGGGGLAMGTIVAVDGHTALSLSLCATLALILAGISSVATLCSVAIARLVVAFCTRLIVALARAIAYRRPRPALSCRVAARPPQAAVVPTAFGRGLRAPPLPAH
jgi:hypothetical protein